MKYILFDADGVLIHSEMFSLQYQKDYNVPNEKMPQFFNGVFRDCIIGKADLKKEISPYLKDWNWTKSVEKFLEYWFQAENKVDNRIVELISDLRKKGIQCFLTTNQEKYRVKFMKKEMKCNEIFDGVFSSSEIGVKKTNIDFYNYILNKLQIGAQDILFVDDEKENIDTAMKIGINGYKYSDFEKFRNYLEKIT